MIYYHPHGIGDLIMAMPYIEQRQSEDENLYVNVRPYILRSGFFNNYRHKDRVFGSCPDIWDNCQAKVNTGKLDHLLAHAINPEKGFYLTITKGQNRRKQFADLFGIAYDPRVQGKVYITELDRYMSVYGCRSSVFASYGAATLSRCAPPWAYPCVKGLNSVDEKQPINWAFAQLEGATDIYVTNSVFLHAAAAMGRDIDVLYNPWYYDMRSIMPENITIKKIKTGNIIDVLGGVARERRRRH